MNKSRLMEAAAYAAAAVVFGGAIYGSAKAAVEAYHQCMQIDVLKSGIKEVTSDDTFIDMMTSIYEMRDTLSDVEIADCRRCLCEIPVINTLFTSGLIEFDVQTDMVEDIRTATVILRIRKTRYIINFVSAITAVIALAGLLEACGKKILL